MPGNPLSGGFTPQGPAGSAGSSATVSVGTLSMLASTASPTVSNSGTASAAVLNFGIPGPLRDSSFGHGLVTWDPTYGGIYGDAGQCYDAVSTAGSNIITSASGAFAPLQVGGKVVLSNAGANVGILSTTVLTVTSTSITLATNAAGAFTNRCAFGHDDSTSIIALGAEIDQTPGWQVGSSAQLPCEGVMMTGLVLDSRCEFRGDNMMSSIIWVTPGSTIGCISAKASTSYKQSIYNLAMYGLAYFQTTSVDLIDHSGTSATTPETDTFNRYANLQLEDSKQNSINYAQRGQSHFNYIDILSSTQYGILMNAFDCDGSVIDAQGFQMGLYFSTVAGSFRLASTKPYFSGQKCPSTGTDPTTYGGIGIYGSAMTLVGFEVQETCGAGLAVIGVESPIYGKRNTLMGGDFADIGDLKGNYGSGQSLSIMAMLHLKGATGNRIQATSGTNVLGTVETPTGSISGTTLTTTVGNIKLNGGLTGVNVLPGTTVTGVISATAVGSAYGTGQFTVNQSQTVASTTLFEGMNYTTHGVYADVNGAIATDCNLIELMIEPNMPAGPTNIVPFARSTAQGALTTTNAITVYSGYPGGTNSYSASLAA